MCTLSAILGRDDLLRVAMNRDELDDRPEAVEPRISWTRAGKSMMPTDPESDGTWIAVNDAGVVLAVLNVNSAHAPPVNGRLSRGRIIPTLLEAQSANDAHQAGKRIHFTDFSPFSLVTIDRDVVASIRFDGQSVSTQTRPMNRPVMFTSSGLGDELVEPPRRALFDRLIQETQPTAAAQDTFHRYRWSDRPHLSVNMLRPGARTVSRTLIEVGRDGVSMSYHSTRTGQACNLSIPLAEREAVLA